LALNIVSQTSSTSASLSSLSAQASASSIVTAVSAARSIVDELASVLEAGVQLQTSAADMVAAAFNDVTNATASVNALNQYCTTDCYDTTPFVSSMSDVASQASSLASALTGDGSDLQQSVADFLATASGLSDSLDSLQSTSGGVPVSSLRAALFDVAAMSSAVSTLQSSGYSIGVSSLGTQISTLQASLSQMSADSTTTYITTLTSLLAKINAALTALSSFSSISLAADATQLNEYANSAVGSASGGVPGVTYAISPSAVGAALSNMASAAASLRTSLASLSTQLASTGFAQLATQVCPLKCFVFKFAC
jgi:hypothetical protein